jgi:cell division protein FtsB
VKTTSLKIVFPAIFLVMFVLLIVIVLGDNGLVELNRLRHTRKNLLESNARLTQENVQLYRAIERLQSDPVYVETVARRELGMIRSDEVIFKFKKTP